MADLVTPPPTRRGAKRSRRDVMSYKQDAARDLQAVFDLPESPESAKAARASSSSTPRGTTVARALSAKSARSRTPVKKMAARKSGKASSKLSNAIQLAAAANAESSHKARALGAALPMLSRRKPSAGSSAGSVELRRFMMTIVPSLHSVSSVDEVSATTMKEVVRATQLARLNICTDFKRTLSQQHAGVSGTELQQTLQLARQAGNGNGCHKQLKLSINTTRGAFLRLFGERVNSTCTSYGQFVRLPADTRAALLVNAGAVEDGDASLEENKKDWRAEWDMVADILADTQRVTPYITLGSFKTPLRSELHLDYLMDRDMVLDAMLPRPAGRWVLGKFMSVGGTRDVFAELCPSSTATAVFTPNTEDASSCMASIRTTFAGKPKASGLTRSTAVCRDFLKARGTVTITLPLRYASGPSA